MKLSKKVVFGPTICRGRDTPNFGDAFSNYTYFRLCGRIWFSSVQRPRRLADEKKTEETLVKYKSADIGPTRDNRGVTKFKNRSRELGQAPLWRNFVFFVSTPWSLLCVQIST